MHEHRTIPQRLNDHDAVLHELGLMVVDLLERVEKLEGASSEKRATTKPATKEEA